MGQQQCCAEQHSHVVLSPLHVEPSLFGKPAAVPEPSVEEEEDPVKEAPESVTEEPPAPEPEQSVQEVECTISREAGSAWGMTLESVGQFLLIDAIKSGAVAKYNEGVDEKAQLRKEDYVTMVNQATSAPEMRAILQNADRLSVTLKVCRPEQITHQIVRREDGQSCGIQVTFEKQQKGVQVRGITEGGAAYMYNMGRELWAQLQPDDLIIGCNGKADSAKDIIARLKDQAVKTIELKVVRVGKLAEQQQRAAGA